MRRGITRRALEGLLQTIRERVPDIALRTTLIVGYPTETQESFEELLQFIGEQEFHRLGVFSYSQEEGTGAFPLGDPVPAEEKERRRAAVMELQQEISLRRNEALVDSRVRVLIDRVEGDRYVGRTEHDAPEIDNEVFVESASPLAVGTMVMVDIVDVSEYDLYGRV